MLARSKSRQFAFALALLPALVTAGEPAGSVADISSHDAAGLEFFRGPVDFLKARQLFERETFGGNGLPRQLGEDAR